MAELDQHLNSLNGYMGKMDLGLVEVIDFNAFNNAEIWDKYTAQPNVDGVIYLEYSNHKALNGALKWANGKPIVTPRDMLWEGNAGSDNASVLNHIHAAPRNPKNAAVVSGVLLAMFGLFAWKMIAFINILPLSFIVLLTGFSLLGVFIQSVQLTFSEAAYRYSTDFTFAIAVANVAFQGISAPVWCLAAGIVTMKLLGEGKGGAV
ncbi:hypothetical protein BK133_24210 [Paenibacillus sp. FSL H8-0548]|nr:hypothetical protein BK133_24210 [Paenibacillus sp. FSL H8-0548]